VFVRDARDLVRSCSRSSLVLSLAIAVRSYEAVVSSAVRATERKRRRSVSIGVFVVGVPVTRRRKSCSTGSPRHLVTRAPIAGKQKRRILTSGLIQTGEANAAESDRWGSHWRPPYALWSRFITPPIQTDRNTATRSHAGCAPPASMWLKPEGQAGLQKGVRETERSAS